MVKYRIWLDGRLNVLLHCGQSTANHPVARRPYRDERLSTRDHWQRVNKDVVLSRKCTIAVDTPADNERLLRVGNNWHNRMQIPEL